MRGLMNKKIFIRTLGTFLASLLLVLSSYVYAADPGVNIFVGLTGRDNVGRIDYQNISSLNYSLNQKNIPVYMYGGAPQYYINTPTNELFNSIGSFLQQSSTPSNIVWWSGHGTYDSPGGWANTYASRDEFFSRARQVADSVGKDMIIIDGSCGSGACVNPAVSQYLGGHLKGVITASGPGQTAWTGQLEEMFQGAGQFAKGVDVNGDGAISLGEIKRYSDSQGWPFKFAGDMNHKVFYSKDAPLDKNPELAENVCHVLVPTLDAPGVTDDLAIEMNASGYSSTVQEEKSRILSEQKEGAKVYFFVPNASDIRTFLNRLKGGAASGASYDINGLQIQPGAYGIGKTILLGGASSNKSNSAYFKLTSGDACTAEQIKYETSAPANTLGNNGATPFTNPGAPGLGANSLLPALLSGLLGQGFGGGGFGNQNTPATQTGNLYTQQDPCAQLAESPVCGEDGKTYKNSCYLSQERVTLKSQGVCPAPTPTVNASSIIGQLSQSGIPSSLIDAVSNVVATIVSGIVGGALPVPETVVEQ